MQLGYTHLKDLQLKVVTYFVAGEAVIAILLTGYGKSVMPALPLLLDHIHQLQVLQKSIVITVTSLCCNEGSDILFLALAIPYMLMSNPI